MKYIFVVLIALLCATFAHGEAINYDGNIPAYGLLQAVEDCDTVAVGTVHSLTGVMRSFGICTDVMFQVETLIKSETNMGTRFIKFLIPGGTAWSEEHQDMITLKTVPDIVFKVGERVLLFMQKGEDGYGATYPYEGRRVYAYNFGKRLIEDGKVSFKYNKNDVATDIGLPINAAVELAKAFQRDKDDAKALESQIKALVRAGTEEMSDSAATVLINSAKLIKEETK